VGSGAGSRPEGFDVTSQKQLKARIRTRMAATGERYAAARAQLVGTGGEDDDLPSVVDTGWTLRGGSDPDAAALANILANSRVVGPEGPLSEELIVDAANMGIRNIAFYIDTRKPGIEAGDVHPDLQKPATETITLDNNKCQFIPHVVAVRTGQTIKVLNSDQEGHNANFSFFNNDSINVTIPPAGFKDIQFPKGERAPSPVACNIHPWMTAHLLLFDLPYAGVSDAKGVLKIEKLPAGKPITFKLWHENQDKSIDKVNYGGKDAEWAKGNVELTLKPGMNDLGVIKIKPDKFKNK
jgi:hypothetical protein